MGSPHIAVYSASKHAGDRVDRSVAWESAPAPAFGDQLRLPRPDRQPHAHDHPPGPHAAATHRRRTDKIVDRIPARRLGLGVRSRRHRRLPRLRRCELRLGLAYTVDGGRTGCLTSITNEARNDARRTDADAAAVYEAFKDANRPPYETLTAPEARADYLRARFATNPTPRSSIGQPDHDPRPARGDPGTRLHAEEAAPIERTGALPGVPPRRRLRDRRPQFPRTSAAASSPSRAS